MVLGCDRCLVAACCPQGAVTNAVAGVAKLPPLPPNPPGLPLACSSRWFIDSALLKAELLLTRQTLLWGSAFPAGALSLCSLGTNGGHRGECFQGCPLRLDCQPA